MIESLLIIVILLLLILCVVGAWIALELRWGRYFRAGVAALTLAGSAQAQPKELVGPQQPVKLTKLWTPADAQAAALADLLTLPAEQRLLTRYIWIRDPSAEAVQSVTRTLNLIARGRIFRPVVLAENRLLRVDLALLCFDVDDELSDIIDVWESYRFQPDTHLLITPDMLKIILQLPESQWPIPIVRTAKGFERGKLNQLADADVIRIPIGDAKIIEGLQLATLSAASVTTKEYFELRALRQFQGQGAGAAVYRAIWSGKYYAFKGIKPSKDKGVSDLDALKNRLGADLESVAEQRLAIKRSGVTGSSRAVELLPTNKTVRVSDGRAAFVITGDVRLDSLDASQNALQSLDRRTFKPDGREALWVDRNGMQAAALFDGKGSLVDSVPIEIASDTTIPAQFHKILEPMISCDRCHAASGHDGWQPMKNSLEHLLGHGVDVFGDASRKNESINRTLQRLADQYRGNADPFLRDARNDYQRATLAAIGPWKSGKPTEILKLAAKRLEEDTSRYWYGEVNAAVALRELGFDAVPPSEALKFLRTLLKPDESTRAFGILPEDVRLAFLLTGETISRQEWALVYSFAAGRAQNELAKMAHERKP